jgi:hypothetical protein
MSSPGRKQSVPGPASRVLNNYSPYRQMNGQKVSENFTTTIEAIWQRIEFIRLDGLARYLLAIGLQRMTGGVSPRCVLKDCT